LIPAEERGIVRWIVPQEEFGFPPRMHHVKEAIIQWKYPELGMEIEVVEEYFQ